jgi:hypothetical protein
MPSSAGRSSACAFQRTKMTPSCDVTTDKRGLGRVLSNWVSELPCSETTKPRSSRGSISFVGGSVATISATVAQYSRLYRGRLKRRRDGVESAVELMRMLREIIDGISLIGTLDK